MVFLSNEPLGQRDQVGETERTPTIMPYPAQFSLTSDLSAEPVTHFKISDSTVTDKQFNPTPVTPGPLVSLSLRSPPSLCQTSTTLLG